MASNAIGSCNLTVRVRLASGPRCVRHSSWVHTGGGRGVGTPWRTHLEHPPSSSKVVNAAIFCPSWPARCHSCHPEVGCSMACWLLHDDNVSQHPDQVSSSMIGLKDRRSLATPQAVFHKRQATGGVRHGGLHAPTWQLKKVGRQPIIQCWPSGARHPPLQPACIATRASATPWPTPWPCCCAMAHVIAASCPPA